MSEPAAKLRLGRLCNGEQHGHWRMEGVACDRIGARKSFVRGVAGRRVAISTYSEKRAADHCWATCDVPWVVSPRWWNGR